MNDLKSKFKIFPYKWWDKYRGLQAVLLLGCLPFFPLIIVGLSLFLTELIFGTMANIGIILALPIAIILFLLSYIIACVIGLI